jgi:anti-sigma factor RsiW
MPECLHPNRVGPTGHGPDGQSPNCQRIDSLVTPYVDGNIDETDRDLVDRHLSACRPCRGRVHAERAVHALICTRRSALGGDAVPPALRARCALLGRPAAPLLRTATRGARATGFALAAALVLVVAGAFVFEATGRSTRVLAAELTADHMKCFRVLDSGFGAHQGPQAVESAMASFGWQMRLPEHADRAGLELVGARRCVYGQGVVAHIMYRHNGTPVSIFMLPNRARPEELIEVMGHQAAIWSVGDRTFVLIARQPRAEVERMTSFVHSALR